MITVKMFEREDIQKVIEFEQELRKQEPNTYYWEPDENYVKQLEESFSDERFNTAVSLVAYNDETQRFYRNVENASIHDTGIWMDI